MIDQAVKILKRGGLVILPTDTSYGLAADATNPEAIKKVFQIKGRDFNKPVSVIVSDLKMAQKYALVTPLAKKLFKAFLPGPLTLVLKQKVSSTTIGIRVPNLKLNLEIAKKLGRPYTATSANQSGQPDCYSVSEIKKQLGSKIKLVDLIIDKGTLPKIPPSTILDCTLVPPKILREGPIDSSLISAKIFSK